MSKKKAWYKNQDFLALRSQWYAKLKKSGFKDIEYFDQRTGDALPLLGGYGPMDAVRFYRPDSAEFYRLAVHFMLRVQEMYGVRSWQYKAWKAYADGVGIMRISKSVGKSAASVDKFVKNMRTIMLEEAARDIAEDKKYTEM